MAASTNHSRKASPAKKVSDRCLRAALVKHDGLLSRAANEVGLTRQSVHERVNNNPELFAFVQDLRTGTLDLAESTLVYQMRENHCRASAEFYLKNLGKTRGYGPQPEIPAPPPDNSRRFTIIRQLVLMMDNKAAALHAQPPMVDVIPKPAFSGNGHGLDPAAQLLAAKKGNGKGYIR
jgi:hypothetical protein